MWILTVPRLPLCSKDGQRGRRHVRCCGCAARCDGGAGGCGGWGQGLSLHGCSRRSGCAWLFRWGGLGSACPAGRCPQGQHSPPHWLHATPCTLSSPAADLAARCLLACPPTHPQAMRPSRPRATWWSAPTPPAQTSRRWPCLLWLLRSPKRELPVCCRLAPAAPTRGPRQGLMVSGGLGWAGCLCD